MTASRTLHRIASGIIALLLAVGAVGAHAALTKEQATQVGGPLGEAGKQLAALEAAALKVADAAPGTAAALATALETIARSPGARTFGQQAGLVAASVLLLAVLVLAYRRATRSLRGRLDGDPLPARGAAWQLSLDAGDRVIVAVLAYLLIKSVFNTGSLHDLFTLALLWTAVRWWLAMFLLEALLRPSRPAFRLITMNDAAALQVKWIVGASILAGFTGISVMPVLLRAGLPVPEGQVLALLQGSVVAAGCAAALWRYRASRSAPRVAARGWSLLAGFGIVLLWAGWSVSVLVLDFATYHAFTWSMRIGVLAFLAHALLGLSERVRRILLLQRSITAAAGFAIAILLAEVWLVERLNLVTPEDWTAARHSLMVAAATLFAGYVAWRGLYYWTEERLRTAASRLTTVLPMLRMLAGIAILVITVLLALSQLGVEITPLLAGAGVVGLAVSFGAQTLIKDIITGAFFLVDDAFRVGEYIVSGTYRGTVDAITLRSVKLRHHKGSVYWVSFGELRAIQNMSRDWVIDEFSIGITYDSNIEKARSLIKEIGITLAADPGHAPHIIEPLEMLGVDRFGDFAVEIGVRMKTRPFEQFVIRRKANAMIKKAFDENGVMFAFPTVQVAGNSDGGGSAAAARQALALAQAPAVPG